MEQDEEELELMELHPGDKGNVTHLKPPAHHAGIGEDLNESYSSATLKILASMPSRTIGRSRGAIISEYYNRTNRLRRRKSRPSIHDLKFAARPSIRQYSLDFDTDNTAEEEKRSLLVTELQNLSSAQRNHLLQTMPMSLAVKLELRHMTCVQQAGVQRRGSLPCCSRTRYHIIMGFRNLWYTLLSFVYSLQPWHYSLKQISGRFGSSVLSYFLFLKTLLMFSIFLCLLSLFFIVLPQAMHPPKVMNQRTFTGLELLTGAGSFTFSSMYYGYYSNFTLNEVCANGSRVNPVGQLPYNMPLAYAFTVVIAFFITCIVLVYSMSRSFGESYRIGSTSGDLANKVFCSWDFKVIQRRSVRLQHENILIQLKELLCERKGHAVLLITTWAKLRNLAVHTLVWILSLGSVLGSAILVYYISEYMHKVYRGKVKYSSEIQLEALLLPLPLLVSLINLLLPYLYSLLALWEKQDSPILEVYIAICRNLILKMVILGVLCYHWLGRKMKYLENQCWETFIGQELYRFVVMDFIFMLLDTFFGEMVWRFILEKKQKRKPEFDIARNVLELIYGQTLTWLGFLFVPLLPAVQTLQLLLLFYIKKMSLMRNCQCPSKPWRASHMSTIFITLLCFPSFLGAAIFLSYSIWSVKPSDTCGPFQTLGTISEAGRVWIQELEKSNPRLLWFTWIYHYVVKNTFCIFLAAGVLMIVIYFYIEVVNGQRKIIVMLKEQIGNEGEDKKFLIQKIHLIYRKQKREDNVGGQSWKGQVIGPDTISEEREANP
ncbi:transmembrane channel-like protein 6 isoform X2 [Microcaecilia unicolor]|uniref:Transmembrane channel-like protein n=1 Tax=Microcaecilia unicolor TaxID=1415580 RepID=A0A6P7YN99_9AMPH|nr:transmembrane channel-like protein 6 isoform X1 [Microcaecilia unicolor]XP_030064520.1 transmembrane channel-like protein 6 isoform X1 [Microcaecilia unicolor]XP_030064521.1 transmembrane channel-like protein 6 isoform X2 [Microcaecilia unicolor]